MLPPIKHIFVVMFENRSFDHMLGFSGLVGTDLTTGRQSTIDGASPACANVDQRGNRVAALTPAPFILDVDPPHDFLSVEQQLCGVGGHFPLVNNAGFLSTFQQVAPGQSTIMDCFDPAQVPVLYTLAREFAICDRWFSSMPGPTWPNRFFIHAASSAGLDDSPTKSQVITSSLIEGYRFANGTIYDRLDAAGIEWRIYHGDDFPQTLAIRGMNGKWLDGQFRDFGDFQRDLGAESFSPAYVFIEPSYGHVLTHQGDFRCGNSQHPLDDVTRGEKLLKEIYETLRASPHWEESVLVVTYDEHGGFYDHVVPPPAIAPGDPITDEEGHQHAFGFDQLGVRVPGLIVSPFVPRNVVDHTQYDHTSVLASVEALFGLDSLTDRDKTAENFWHLCVLPTPRKDAPAILPDPAPSGFTGCDESIENELDQLEEGDVGAGAAFIGGTLAGFLRVALLRHLELASDVDKKAIIGRYLAVQTRREARAFLVTVKGVVAQARQEIARTLRW